MLATTVLLLLLGWLCGTTVLALRAAPPREEILRQTAGPVRPPTPRRLAAPDPLAEPMAYRPSASQATALQAQVTLPRPPLRELAER